LTLALGLMRDVHGVIALTIPVSGDRRGGARLDVGAVIAEALRHAIVNALASPLRLLGAVVAGDDKVDATPQPIGFAPGRPEVDAEARTRVEQLGTVLGSAPALRLELRGSAGGPDVRALQEAAILADLAADRGALGTLRNLASRGTRNAIRDVLAARASGKSGELSPELQKTLDEWAAERTVSDGDLRALAAARAARLRSLLVQDFGIAAERLALAEPAVDQLRVLEVGSGVAAAYGAKLLADLGAQVIKVESPGGGDATRARGPFPGNVPHPEKSGLFLYLNANKRGLTLDLTRPRGREVLEHLAARADLLVHDVHPSEMAGRGLDYERLSATHPALVMTSIAPFGLGGPHAGYRGPDVVTWSAGGVAALNGEPTRPDLPPLKAFGDQSGFQAGL